MTNIRCPKKMLTILQSVLMIMSFMEKKHHKLLNPLKLLVDFFPPRSVTLTWGVKIDPIHPYSVSTELP